MVKKMLQYMVIVMMLVMLLLVVLVPLRSSDLMARTFNHGYKQLIIQPHLLLIYSPFLYTFPIVSAWHYLDMRDKQRLVLELIHSCIYLTVVVLSERETFYPAILTALTLAATLHWLWAYTRDCAPHHTPKRHQPYRRCKLLAAFAADLLRKLKDRLATAYGKARQATREELLIDRAYRSANKASTHKKTMRGHRSYTGLHHNGHSQRGATSAITCPAYGDCASLDADSTPQWLCLRHRLILNSDRQLLLQVYHKFHG